MFTENHRLLHCFETFKARSISELKDLLRGIDNQQLSTKVKLMHCTFCFTFFDPSLATDLFYLIPDLFKLSQHIKKTDEKM